MASYNLPLSGPGWNYIYPYPVQAARPVTEALLSISGYYTTVYGYIPTDTVDPWRVYDVSISPTALNDLQVLEFGEAYWINVAADVVLRLKGDGSVTIEAPISFNLPPATYYGAVIGNGFTAGMSVEAWIGNTLCGQSQTQWVNGQLMYLLKVESEGPGANHLGCGAAGRVVTFKVNGQILGTAALWNNDVAHRHNLFVVTTQIYLPIIRR